MTDGDVSDAADLFSSLDNPIRLNIVRLLHDGPVDAPAAFSTLYDHAEMDDSAQFNYHLQQLVPDLVSKSDDGYALTSAGERIAMAVTAGSYTETPTLEPFETGGQCYACGESALRAAYDDEWLTIDCTNCGETVLSVQVPPTIARGRDPEAVIDAFDEWSRQQINQARHGLCPNCGGPVDRSVSEGTADRIAFDAVAVFECQVCGRRPVTSFGSIAASHPTVETFFRQRGVSFEDTYYWERDQFVSGETTEILSRDPWLVRVSFTADGDACHVDIDGNLEVVETTIVPGGASTED